MNTYKAKDGTTIYYKNWGSGQPIRFSHGWPLNADAWDNQMLFLGQQGYRVIAHDRRPQHAHERGSSSHDQLGKQSGWYAERSLRWYSCQIVPFAEAGLLTAKLVGRAQLKVYPGLPHEMAIITKTGLTRACSS